MGFKSDVYSFSVIMWELYTGQRPLQGLAQSVLLARRLMGRWALQLPAGTPPAYEVRVDARA